MSPDALAKVIKDGIQDSGGYILFFGDDIVIDSFSSFIVWDDANQLIHAITATTVTTQGTIYDQVNLPFKVRSLPYSMLERVAKLYDSSPAI